MSEALKLWLRETWELWYWAMFCPSQLQQRIEAKKLECTKESIFKVYKEFCMQGDPAAWQMSLFSWRFFLQFLLITCIFSVPVFFLIFLHKDIWTLFLLFIVFFGIYLNIAYAFLPFSLQIPLIFGVIYFTNSQNFLLDTKNFVDTLPDPLQILSGIGIGLLGLIQCTIALILRVKYSEQKIVLIASITFFIMGILSIYLGYDIGGYDIDGAYWIFFILIACMASFLPMPMDKSSIPKIKKAKYHENKYYEENPLAIFLGVKPIEIDAISIDIWDIAYSMCSYIFFPSSIIAYSYGFHISRVTEGSITGLLGFIAILLIGSSSNWIAGGRIYMILTYKYRSTTGIVRGLLVLFAVFVVGCVAILGTILSTALIVGSVVGGAKIFSELSLPWLLLVCWLIAVSISPSKQQWIAITISIVFIALGFENHGLTVFTVIPVVLAGYYRFFDFFVFEIISEFIPRIRFPPREKTLVSSFHWLKNLPPFTSELLWLPITNHSRLLVDAFQEDSAEAIPIFQSIREQPLYGFQQTIKNALPQLIADQLIAVHTIPELIATATPNHAILPLLVPSLYQTELVDNQSLNVELLPTFQKYAQNIEAALQAGSIALRERGLERILDQLSTLNSQLSGLVKSKSIPRWQNVIKQWQTIIQQELEQLQRQSQGEILNPFQYGNPLTRDRAQLFKGRSAFADQIVRQILDRNRPTIILHGPRRCGKSSFLLNLPRLLTSDVLPVYIDLQNQSASQSEADFWFTIVRAIYHDARSQQVHLPAPPKREEFYRSPYTQLEDWLDTALTQLGDRRVLLNIDEFEKIGEAMEKGRITTALFDQLRSFIQHKDRLSFLFSGVQTLDELGTNWSSYFISAMPIEMTYLNPNEATELLLNPDPEFTLEYDTGIVDQILTLTRCHPYLLQLLGWVLVQLANTTHTQLVTPTLLQSAIPEAYINGIGYFTNVWEQFTGTSPTEIIAGQQQLLALAQGQQPHPTNESDQKSLQRMLRYHIIEKIDNQYKFEVPLIERWVREKSN
jgi:hypothetical protein